MGLGGRAVNRSSLTEETPATPGWVDAKVRAIFSPYGDDAIAVGEAYADCLAGLRGGVDVELGQDGCRSVALRSMSDRVNDTVELDRALQALEAEIADAT